jgi:hypothetical protein
VLTTPPATQLKSMYDCDNKINVIIFLGITKSAKKKTGANKKSAKQSKLVGSNYA